MINQLTAIKSLLPTAQVAFDGDVVTWVVEPVTRPTDAEIQAELDRLIAEQPLKIAQQSRASAYAAEADPLFFKVQRGEATEADWLAKVEEIRARFPYSQEAES